MEDIRFILRCSRNVSLTSNHIGRADHPTQREEIKKE